MDVVKKEMILIHGRPETKHVIYASKDRHGVFWVKFTNGKTYHLSDRDVCILRSPKLIDPADCRIFSASGMKIYPQHVWEYHYFSHRYYRIEFKTGDVKEYDSQELRISKSVLADENARQRFDYLKQVSGVQQIITETGPISLYGKYEKIDFVDEKTALGSYLNPKLLDSNKKGFEHLLFPFYSNLSQMAAVDNAFKSQISVIQGPPGTGKTQTILNIVANIIARRHTVLIVSNNNSAVENVKEKLDKAGLGFVVAELGKQDNRNDFVKHGQLQYPDMSDWNDADVHSTICKLDSLSKELHDVFEKQNQLAMDRQLYAALETESKHFFEENNYDVHRLDNVDSVSCEQVFNLWMKLDIKHEDKDNDRFPWRWCIRFFKNIVIKHNLKSVFGKVVNEKSDEEIIMDLKALYYCIRKNDVKAEINDLALYLKNKHADELLKKQVALSMKILKAALFILYDKGTEKRPKFTDEDLIIQADKVAKEYPVVLSTTFSAMSSLPGHVFDYLIMDEASQVPVESAALAMSKAKCAVIVGDLKQLPNIISEDDREKLEKIGKSYKIGKEYDCTLNSFLSSVLKVFPNVPQTLLKEHYRCAPMIIDYCNQKFYGGQLVIMTRAADGENPLKVIKTVKGNHSRSMNNGDDVLVFNQREVDEFKRLLSSDSETPLGKIGVITPYKGQAMLFHKEISNNELEADTIHKYQGREKDVIVMSTVADRYNNFVDDPNLINVAVSRAKRKFILITNGNENPEGNIKDLIEYVNYNHGKIEKSNLHSVFDLLYAAYAEQRKKYLIGKSKVSEYDSENIAYNVICSVLKRNADMANLEIIPHYHLSSLISDTSMLSEYEEKFICSSWSHVDFLIENRVSKKPVLVIEVDGFAYHHKGTQQSERDKIKDGILEKCNIPLLRLSTAGSGEVEKIESKLKSLC